MKEIPLQTSCIILTTEAFTSIKIKKIKGLIHQLNHPPTLFVSRELMKLDQKCEKKDWLLFTLSDASFEILMGVA